MQSEINGLVFVAALRVCQNEYTGIILEAPLFG
jgi:hypothetical protein